MSAWSEVDHAPKEASSLAKPSKPNAKAQLRHHDTASVHINYRFFDDWRSHIIYYKQIKGYSHNQHLGRLNPRFKRSSEEAAAAAAPRQTGLPFVETRGARLQRGETLESVALTLGQVSERNMERSFQYAAETQSAFFAKKSSGSLTNIAVRDG